VNIPELLEVYRRIGSGEDSHGDFLTQFANAFIRADYENLRLLRPLALVLGYKYKLWPGAGTVSPDSAALEQMAMRLAVTTDAAGVVMVILHHNQRAEIVAGLREEVPDLAGVLQKLADQVKDGDGMPIGKDGRIVNTEA
jgi:hypothetical protein